MRGKPQSWHSIGLNRLIRMALAHCLLLATKQVLRNASLGEDKVTRGLELLAQMREIDVEQPSLPLAHLSRDDHGFNVGPVHQRDNRARHLVKRRHVDRGSVEDDDVGFLTWRERADLLVEPQSFSSVYGGEAQHVTGGQQRRRASRWCRRSEERR